MHIKKIFAAIFTVAMMLTFIPGTAMAATTGWQQTSSGWRYYTDSSNYVKSAWKSIGGKWYYFNGSGYALTNTWQDIDGKLYHFSGSGAMDTNKWIDCGKSSMAALADSYGTANDIWSQYKNTRNWRYVGADGAAYIGWKKVGTQWYYFEDGSNYSKDFLGYMSYGPALDNTNTLYWFDKDGKYVKNSWIYIYIEKSECWLYFGADGKGYADKWLKSGNKWYYFDNDYVMISNTTDVFIGGTYYDFDNNGACKNPDGRRSPGWHQVVNGTYVTDNGWCFYNAQGYLCKGWQKINNNWYLFDSKNGIMKTGYLQIDGKYYYIRDSGILQTGWFQLPSDNKNWYYAGPDGAVYKGQWLNQNGKWYYFRNQTFGPTMVANTTDFLINGKYYDFDANGVCMNPNGRTEKAVG